MSLPSRLRRITSSSRPLYEGVEERLREVESRPRSLVCHKARLFEALSHKQLTGQIRPKILSIGVGDGFYDYLVARRFPQAEITAVDVVHSPMTPQDEELLKRLCPSYHLEVFEPNAPFPYSDDTFDFVFHLDVLEHVEHPQRFLTECRRILRPGGTLLLSTPNIFRPFSVASFLTGRRSFPDIVSTSANFGLQVHTMEYYQELLQLDLESSEFSSVNIMSLYVGIWPLDLCFSKLPTSAVGKRLSHDLMAVAVK